MPSASIRASKRIGVDVTVRPDSRYGVSKAFGEALGALYADKHGLRVTCLRIGNFGDAPIDKRRLCDLAQAGGPGATHPHRARASGTSFRDFLRRLRQWRSWWDNSTAFRLGYRPRWRAEDYRDQALAAERGKPQDPVGEAMQGGPFASAEFSGDIERL